MVIERRCEAFHFKRMGEKFSGWKSRTRMRMAPERIKVVHSVQRQETREDCPMNPPTTGPKI